MAETNRPDDFGFDAAWSDADLQPAGVGLQIAAPRVLWLFLAGGVSLVGGALAALFGQMIVPAVSGWLLSGPIAIGLLALFVHTETKRRARPTIVTYAWVQPLYVGCMVLALAAVLVSALRIALWFGRL